MNCNKLIYYGNKDFSMFLWRFLGFKLFIHIFKFQAVFKNYDHDKDGFISHTEFELIAGNFPFIDSFCVLDADQ